MSLTPGPSAQDPPKAVFFLLSSQQSIKLLKFTDDTTLIGLISGGDKSVYRLETEHMLTWCSDNNLELNALETVEMTVDFSKNQVPPAPITMCDSQVDTVESFHFLGTFMPTT